MSRWPPVYSTRHPSLSVGGRMAINRVATDCELSIQFLAALLFNKLGRGCPPQGVKVWSKYLNLKVTFFISSINLLWYTVHNSRSLPFLQGKAKSLSISLESDTLLAEAPQTNTRSICCKHRLGCRVAWAMGTATAVWREVAMDSLKYSEGPSCPTPLCPALWPFQGWPSSTPLGHPMPYASGHGHWPWRPKETTRHVVKRQNYDPRFILFQTKLRYRKYQFVENLKSTVVP
jgi:hypothetical protein